MSQIRGVTEHYFPARYDAFGCIVHSFDVEVKDFRQMEVRTSFTITGSDGAINGLYEEENWKFMRTEFLLERFPEEKHKFTAPAPIFCLMLNKWLQVVSADIRRDGREVESVYDADADMLALPTSFPPLADLPSDQNYVYYDKKSAVFYADIELGQKYDVRILLEANAATFEFAPLFPFGKVNFEKISTTSSGEYGITPVVLTVAPEVGKQFPDWFQYQLDKLTSFEPRLPHFRPALPYRGDFPLFDVMQDLAPMIIGNASPVEVLKAIEKREIDLSKPILLKDYNTIRFAFSVVIPLGKDIDIMVRSIQRPLPPRIYEQMQKLPNYRDVLVEYDIFNLSKNKLRLKIETEVLGLSDKEVKVVFMHGMSNKQNQKARKMITQCPRLKVGMLEKMATPQKATMLCKVTDEDSKKVLFEQTYNIDLLANDEMVWELEDLRSNQKYSLHEFICAWITPTDSAGLMDKVRSEASKFHPDKMLGHVRLDTSDAILSHAKAVYDYLASKGMKYLSQPFSSLSSRNSQRVVLPERVLQNNVGNCIDLSVLFASVLEGVGLYSLIFLTKDHAFIGWGDKNNADKMVFLETTLIGSASFEDAVITGKDVFQKNFMMNGGAKPVYIPDIKRMSGCYIVDTQKARHSGQISVRRG